MWQFENLYRVLLSEKMKRMVGAPGSSNFQVIKFSNHQIIKFSNNFK
jgi:hypothetical protein